MGQIKRQVPAVIAMAFGAIILIVNPADTFAADSLAATVTDVRVGAHKGKTRVVLDVSKPTDIRYEISADGNVVFIDLPLINWTAAQFEGRHFKGLVTDFRFSPEAGGGRFNILADGPVRIKKPYFVPPGGKQGHRIVIDLVRDISPNPIASAAPEPLLHRVSQTGGQSQFNPNQMVAGPGAGNSTEEPPEIETMVAMREDRPPQVAQAQHPVPMLRPGGRPLPQRNETMMRDGHGGILGYQNIYLKAQIGVGIVPEFTNTGSGNENAMETSPGFSFTGGLGIDLENSFRVEGEMTYAFNSVGKVAGTGNGSSFNTTFTGGDVASLAFMGNVAYDFPIQNRFTPYVMGGLGLVGLFMNDARADGVVISDSSDFVFGMQLGAGVSMPLDDVVTLEAGYRYMETQDPEFGDQRGLPFTTEFSSHTFTLGTRLKF